MRATREPPDGRIKRGLVELGVGGMAGCVWLEAHTEREIGIVVDALNAYDDLIALRDALKAATWIDGPISWSILGQIGGRDTYILKLPRGYRFVVDDGLANRHLDQVLDDIVGIVNSAVACKRAKAQQGGSR